MPQEKVIARLESAIGKTRSLVHEENPGEDQEKHIRGQIKRMRRILKAFHTHTNHDAAHKLYTLCSDALDDNTYTDALLDEIATFPSIAQTFDERLETQEDRINQAHQDGTARVERYPIPGFEDDEDTDADEVGNDG